MISMKIMDGSQYALVTLSSNGKEVVCSIRGSDWKLHARHVASIVWAVNNEFFNGGLKMTSSRDEVTFGDREGVLVREAPVVSKAYPVKMAQSSPKDYGGVKASEVLSFLRDRCEVTNSQDIAQKMADEDVQNIDVLASMLQDDEADLKDFLKDCGCKRGAIITIKKNLEEFISEKERNAAAKPFVLVVTGDDNDNYAKSSSDQLKTGVEFEQIAKAFTGDESNRKALMLEEKSVGEPYGV